MTTKDIKADYGAEGDGQEVTATLTIPYLGNNKRLKSATSIWTSGDAGVGKDIFIAGAGIAGVVPLRSTIVTYNAADDIEIADDVVTNLVASSQLVAWATNDYQAFADFNAAFQGQTGVVLNIPASSGFYAIWSTGDAGTGFSSGISQLHVIGDNGNSRPTLKGDAAGAHVAALGIGANYSFQGGGVVYAQAFVQTVAAGADHVTCITAADASKFATGDWVALNAFEIQGFGYPSNPAFFEYLEVATSSAITGIVTFTSNVVDARYLSTYPGISGTDIPSGPANILRMGGETGDVWDTECTWESLTVSDLVFQLNIIGRDIRLIDLTTTMLMDPTACKSLTVTNNTWQSAAEFDKFNDTITIDGGDYRFLDFQSGGSGKNVTLSNLHADQVGGNGGSPQNITIDTCSLDYLSMGCNGFTESVTVIDSTAGDVLFVAIHVVDVTSSATISGGTITATGDRSGWGGVAVPGNTCMFTSPDSSPTVYGPSFQVLSVSGASPVSIGDPITIDTSLVSGWPSVPAGGIPLSILRCPMPAVTFTNTSGCVKADDLSRWVAVGNTPGLPYLSFLRRDYDKNTLTSLSDVFRLIGSVTSVTVNVVVAHTGSTDPLYFGPIDETMVLSDGTFSSAYDPHFDLRTVGKRIITPAGITNDQGVNGGVGGLGADADLAFPAAYIWNWNSLRSIISANVSGETTSLSYWWEITTDQGVVSSGTVSTTTALASSANPSAFGDSVTFTATVTPDSGVIVPTGTVTFYDGVGSIGSDTLDGSGQATLATSVLSAGLHYITAVYGGDSGNDPSTSSILAQVVTGPSPAGMVVFTTMM